MTSLCKINALSALLSVFIVSDPFLCVILEVLYIPDFIYFPTMVDVAFE